MVRQMLHYIEMVDRDGVYYGNKAQFLARQEKIVASLKLMLEEDASHD